MRRLDIGCGARKREGCIGLDRSPAADADVLANLDRGLPFLENSIDYVWMNHVIEHVPDFVAMMEEIWRVSRPGSVVEIRGPHFSCPEVVWGDPTHRRALTVTSFLCFTKEHDWYLTKARFHLLDCRLKRSMGEAKPKVNHIWDHPRHVFDWMIQRITNRSVLWVERAERYWCRFIGFQEIQVRLQVEK